MCVIHSTFTQRRYICRRFIYGRFRCNPYSSTISDTLKSFSLSGALIVHNVEKMARDSRMRWPNYDYYKKSVFGDPHSFSKVTTIRNADKKAQRRKSSHSRIAMAIGTEDFLYKENQIFRHFLEEKIDSNTTKARVSMILCSGMQTLNLLYGGFCERVSNEKV